MLKIPPVLDPGTIVGVGGVVSEQCHALVSWIQSAAPRGAKSHSIGVTSCAAKAGVSTVAASLAIAAAQTCERGSLLLDLSCSHSLLAARLGVSGDLGLRRALEPCARVNECVTRSSIPDLSLLAMNESETLQALAPDSRRLSGVLQELEQDFDFIVVDLPPADTGLCFVVAGMLTGMLLVVESHRTDVDEAVRAKQRLVNANAEVLGVIMNKHSSRGSHW